MPSKHLHPRQAYLDQLIGFMGTPLVKVLTGLRRCGKSSLLDQLAGHLAATGVPAQSIIQINFESMTNAHLADAAALYAEVRQRAQTAIGPVYILLDEIQLVANWERAVNSFRVDLDCDITVTGSNARLLSGELATLLAGRYVEIPVYPLSFAEFLTFTDQGDPVSGFQEYLRRGGLPGIHELASPEQDGAYLRSVYDTVLLKDVIARGQIRDTALLERLVTFLLTNLGQTFSARRISEFLKSQRRSMGAETIHNYLKALRGACFIHEVSRYDLVGKKVLETQEKQFVADHSFANALLGFRAEELPHLLENIVCLEALRRGYQVHIGKHGAAEVDFVCDRQGQRLYVQVAYLLATGEILERELAPLRAISDNYRKVIVSLDNLPPSNTDGIERWPIQDFLLAQDW
ncbi:MAG: ATP-binding protein [Bifidobacteriaceae bacterium]|jgi:predicted AAA+ superfamily ATPase|nr:ATP-binding protein [Bifidobacteriaceae bacterium]